MRVPHRTFAGNDAPTVLVIRTMDGDMFGAFLPHPWLEFCNSNNGYFGSPETFLFSVRPFEHFGWVGLTQPAQTPVSAHETPAGGTEPSLASNGAPVAATTYFMHATVTSLAIGGGGDGHGLQLDEELKHGSSYPCSTFGNRGLAKNSDFVCGTVEAWRFRVRSYL